MKTKAAVLWELGRPWEIEELELDGPGENEVLIRYTHAGLCHSDEHLRHGDIVPRFPIVGGHEGAGIIEEIGPGVSRVKPGDHVVCSFIPNCGVCRWCATGQQNICDLGATILDGHLPGGRFVFHGKGQDLGAMCMIGTFSQYATIHQSSVVKVDDDLPLDKAVLVGCGVPTGWGSAVYAAKVEPGETVVVYGIGGIGINAVQGARFAGAARTSSPSTRSRTSARWRSNSAPRTPSHPGGGDGAGTGLDPRSRCRQGDHHRRRRRRDRRPAGLRHDPQGRHGRHHWARRPDRSSPCTSRARS